MVPRYYLFMVNAELLAGQKFDTYANGHYYEIVVNGPAVCGGVLVQCRRIGSNPNSWRPSVVRIAIDGSWRDPSTLLRWMPPQAVQPRCGPSKCDHSA